jgi:membrane-bound inhibitor of C-type lysozyme
MRARSPVKSLCLAVVALVVASGCSPDEPAALAAPEPATRSPRTTPFPEPPLDPPREPRAVPSGESISQLLERIENVGRDTDDIGDVATPVMTRLVYQCSDEVTFAVRLAGDRLDVFPPGLTNNYVVMQRVPSDSGVRYSAANAEFRASRDLATLQIGGERHVDCVSNPAASVWGAVQPNAPR